MELYIHIPFCVRKCRYCDFASFAESGTAMADYADRVAEEAERRAAEIGPQPAETVYVGGGTPSILPPELTERLLRNVFRFFPPAEGAEFTVEANPGTLTRAWLDAVRKAGCSRLSMGLQAAQPSVLKTLGRIHSARQAADSVKLARAAGFEDLNLDLMFGIPGQTLADWRETLDFALSLGPTHLSCYGLIPEEGTPLKADLDAGRLALPDEETERRMYDEALRTLAEAGFIRYEISNFALPGHECRHNIGYWTRVPYLGLGLSAASLLRSPDGEERRETNPATLAAYARMQPRETETVDRREAQFETLMLGLRMTRGVSERDYAAAFGEPIGLRYGPRLESLRRGGLLEHAEGRWFLTRRGMDVMNAALVELMD